MSSAACDLNLIDACTKNNTFNFAGKLSTMAQTGLLIGNFLNHHYLHKQVFFSGTDRYTERIIMSMHCQINKYIYIYIYIYIYNRRRSKYIVIELIYIMYLSHVYWCSYTNANIHIIYDIVHCNSIQ
jgi:hypothetical protein